MSDAADARAFRTLLTALKSEHNRSLPFGQVMADLGCDQQPTKELLEKVPDKGRALTLLKSWLESNSDDDNEVYNELLKARADAGFSSQCTPIVSGIQTLVEGHIRKAVELARVGLSSADNVIIYSVEEIINKIFTD